VKSAFLKHPLAILAGVALGVLLGLYDAPLSARLGIGSFAQIVAVPGQLYLFYLQMTVIPIIITAIASSLGRLMRSRSSAGLIKRIAMVLALCVMVMALTGMILGITGKPGAGLDENTRSLLSKLISSQDKEGTSGVLEISLRAGRQINLPVSGPSLGNFFRDLVPSNIFHALTMGSTMAIVFFSIIFGVAIGILKEESASLLISLLSAIFEAFQKIINWSLYLLPFGLVCLMAAQVAEMGPQIFMAMSKFIILYTAGTVIIFIAATAVIWFRSGIANPFRVLGFLFEPILLAFATRNSMAVLPSAITALDKKMGFNSTSVNLTLPLGMTLGRFGNIFYFAVAAFFVAQIYNTPLGLIHYLIIFIGVIFGGTATAGATGIVTLSMISIILNPLGLPVEAVLVIFMAIDPIIDPFRTFLIVYVNMAATSLIASRDCTNPDTREAATLRVCVRESRDRPPFLYRRDGTFQGLEIDLLGEMARRLGRSLILEDAAALDYGEERWPQGRADLLAGLIVKDQEAPPGFVFSRPWAMVNGQQGTKKELCFLLPAESPAAALIDGILKTLNGERFLKSRKIG
jgi:proton glutamate symport protein